MSPAFDASAGLLRLPLPAVELLGRLAAGADEESGSAPEALALLERLDVIEEGRLHPVVIPLARTIATPLARMVVRVGAPAEAVEARAWLDAGVATYARPVDGLLELVAGPAAGAPVFVAGLVDLGPRPPAPVRGVVTLSVLAVQRLLGVHGSPNQAYDSVAAAVPERWREPLAALWAACRRTWTVRVRWLVGEGRVAHHTLGVIDGGEAGLWHYVRTTGSEGEATLSPTGAREVWRELCGLLPSEGELVGGA